MFLKLRRDQFYFIPYQAFLIAWLILIGLTGLNAQGMPPPPKLSDRVVWMDGGGWAHLPLLPGSPAKVILNGRTEAIPPPPSGGNGWSISDGTIFALSFAIDGERERIWFNRRSLVNRGSLWERMAEVDCAGGIPLFLFPLKKEGCYLALNWADGFTEREQASFAAIFRLRGERLLLDSLVDMPSPFSGLATRRATIPIHEESARGVDEPKPLAPRYICEVTIPGLHPSLWAPASVGDYVILASSKTAILWAFSTEDGRCKRVINLEGLNAEDFPRLGAMNHYLLAMQPTANGTLLLVTRSPEVIPAAIEVSRLAVKAASREMLSRWAVSPASLRWLELDPATWKVEKDPTYRWPLPESGETFEQLSRFQFILDQNGRVQGNLKGTWSDVLAETGLDGKQDDAALTGKGVAEHPEQDKKVMASPSTGSTPIPR